MAKKATGKAALAKAAKKSALTADRAAAAAILAEIVVRTDAFCAAHLDEEYADLCRMLAENLANERPTPLLKGTVEGWVGGIVYTVAYVNFLSDPDQTPHMKTAELYARLGVSEATVQARARTIRQLFDLQRMDPRLSRKSMLDDNPMVWFFQAEGASSTTPAGTRGGCRSNSSRAGVIPYVHPSATDGKAAT